MEFIVDDRPPNLHSVDSMALRFLHTPRSWAVLAILSLIGIFLAVRAFWLVPDSLIVATYELQLPSWPKALDGFKVAAIGDVHGGSPFVDAAKLEEVARRITEAKPDLIVWLGDYVMDDVLGGTYLEPEVVASILGTAKSRYGQVAIIGNHDRWLGTERVERAFRRAGITFLRWEALTLEVDGHRLHLFGLDDFELVPNYWARFEQTKAAWEKIPAGEPLLALTHNPDVFPWIPARVSLTLAAHTHGGQVLFPLVGSPIVPSSFGQRFARGHIVEEGRHMFVNTGIGTSIVPVRLGFPPEISILVLTR